MEMNIFMAKLDGKTPEQIAAEIVDNASQSSVIEISGVRAQELDQIVRYRYSREIYSKGEKHYEQMRDSWRSQLLEKFIESTIKQQIKIAAKQERESKLEFYNLLVSRGTPKAQALEMAGL